MKYFYEVLKAFTGFHHSLSISAGNTDILQTAFVLYIISLNSH